MMSNVREGGIPVRPHPGDVYIIKNDCPAKKGAKLSTNVIRFSRPVIVISSIGNIATVIPCTTNSRWKDTSYPLRLSPTKISYALLAQVKTVDITMLDHEMGKMRPIVFEDLRRAYVSYLQSGKKLDKSVTSRVTEKLDIKIFNPWNVYTDKNYEKFYLTFKADNKGYAIITHPSIAMMRETMDYIDGSFMKYDPEELVFLGRSMYSSDLMPIGVELDDWHINRIANILKSLYGFNVDKQKIYDHNLKDFTEFLSTITSNYIGTCKFIDSIPDDIVFSDDFTNISSEFYIQTIESWNAPYHHENIITAIAALGSEPNKSSLEYVRRKRLEKISDLRCLPGTTIKWMISNMITDFTKVILDQYISKTTTTEDGKVVFLASEKFNGEGYDSEAVSILENFITIMMTKV